MMFLATIAVSMKKSTAELRQSIYASAISEIQSLTWAIAASSARSMPT